MEYSSLGKFEDRASQAFVNRRTALPTIRVERIGRETRVLTDRLRLFFLSDGKAFHHGNLRVEFGMGDAPVVWHAGDRDRGNLGGTTRTLDGVDGRCGVEPGLISRDGWVVVDDSKRLVFERRTANSGQWTVDSGQAKASDPACWDWLTPRDARSGVDWYFLGYGHDFAAALRDFTVVAGRIPLPPRFVFGAWWSRYWAYTDEELKRLVLEFREHGVPLDVLVIDMDWHLDGWTGYTWSPKYFPDPEGFLEWTDSHGLQITLNLHPADGIGRHESMFEDMCRAVGREPAKTEFVPFDCTDPLFVRAYFERLHWPLEEQGVDFWWMDWQQGTKTNTPGLDPLWWLNHLHWRDLEVRRNAADDPSGVRRGRRPLVFSRWGGLGNHRYPIGFSGDTFSTWKSLAWQPRFTSMAGNVGYAYWSHDIGGHQPGPVDPELYVRWVQFGTLSPVLRTHTSKNPLGERRIWASPEREYRAMREAFLLRYRLLPYIYTAARRTYDDATPMCRPLYWEWAAREEGYGGATFESQYLFGDALMVAPVVAAGDRTSRAALVDIWLPPGTWTHWFRGETREGPCVVRQHVGLNEVPMFARGGAIVPTGPKVKWSGEMPLDPVTLVVWPGGTEAGRWRDESGRGELYEDDGDTAGYESGEFARTHFEMSRKDDLLRVVINAAEGRFNGMVGERGWEVRLVDRWPAKGVRVNGVEAAEVAEAVGGGCSWCYDAAKLTNVVRIDRRSVRERIVIDVVLDQADETALRRGLHGRLKLFEELGSLLDGHAPGLLRRARDGGLRRACVEQRGSADVDVFDDGALWRLAREVAACPAADAFRQESICRLLAVSGAIEVIGGAAGRIITRSTIRAATAGAFAIEACASVSGDWREVSRRAEAADGGIVEIAEWQANPPIDATLVRAEAVLKMGGETIRVHFQERVFPSINAWWVAGPFDCDFAAAMKTPFGPELAETVDLSAEYVRTPAPGRPGRTGSATGAGEPPTPAASEPVRWRRVWRSVEPDADPKAEFFVDLHKVFGGKKENAVAYAVAYVDASDPRDAVLALGSDDGVAAWINGEKVHENGVQRGYGSRQDRVPIRLRAGRNEILLKITQAAGAWGFGAHLE